MRRLQLLLCAVALFLFTTESTARAARAIPDPVLVQLEQGYGVVAAEAVSAQPLGQPDQFPRRFAVKFTVQEVLADSLAEPLGVKPGGPLEVELHVGYAAHVEQHGVGENAASPFAPGAKYYLSIRKDAGGRFEHADGAGAARRVERFDPAETTLVRRLRELAAQPKERRVDEALKVVADATESENLRMATIFALGHWAWRGQPDEQTSKRIHTSLEKIWNDPNAGLSTKLVLATDYVLRITSTDWEKSETRQRLMVEHIFAPFPEEPKARQDAIRERDNVVVYLRDYLTHQPQEAGAVIIEKIMDERWPAQFRWRLAGCLQYAYQQSEVERPEWAKALQAYYPKAIETADPWVLRLLAGSVESGAKPDGKRRFVAGNETRDALRRAEERVKAAAKEPGADANAQTAVHDVARALKALAVER